MSDLNRPDEDGTDLTEMESSDERLRQQAGEEPDTPPQPKPGPTPGVRRTPPPPD